MYGKKVAGIFLCVSFQAHGMLTVNQLPKKIAPKKDQILVYNAAKYRVASIENGQYNESFFTNSMVPDTQFNVMSSLDHRSNIQFIRTNKYLYNRYTENTADGIKYKNCLFTKHPFDSDFQTRALFHYAPQHEDQAKILLSIEDVGGYRSKMLKKFELHDSHEMVMYFYKQLFSGNQIGELLDSPELFQKMLKKGLSPNNGKLMRSIEWLSSNPEKFLRILLDDPRADLNMQDENGNTILMRCVSRQNIKLVKILLGDKRVNLNIRNNRGNTVLTCAALAGNAEIMKMLLDDDRIQQGSQEAVSWAAMQQELQALKVMLTHEKVIVHVELKDILFWYNYLRMRKENPEVAQLFFERKPLCSKLLFICDWPLVIIELLTK